MMLHAMRDQDWVKGYRAGTTPPLQTAGTKRVAPKRSSKSRPAELDRQLDIGIAQPLQAIYDSLLKQPIPEEICKLLEKLDDNASESK